jgi:hypothetical protein
MLQVKIALNIIRHETLLSQKVMANRTGCNHCIVFLACKLLTLLPLPIGYVDRVEQSHLKHDTQEVDSCVAVPSMQISWTMLNKHTLLQQYKQDEIINPHVIWREELEHFIRADVPNLLSCCQRSFLEVYWCQPTPFHKKKSLAAY